MIGASSPHSCDESIKLVEYSNYFWSKVGSSVLTLPLTASAYLDHRFNLTATQVSLARLHQRTYAMNVSSSNSVPPIFHRNSAPNS